MGGLGKCPCCKEHKQLTEHHDKEILEKVMICRTCHDILEEYIKIQTKYRARFGSSGEETEGHVRLDEYDEEEYLGGKYSTGAASMETRRLHFEIKRRILENFEGLESHQKKVYTGFYSKTNGACICTLAIRKSKVKLKYSVTPSKNILSTSEFVRYAEAGGFGVGEYQSDIKNEKDIEQALPHIQKVYDYKTKD